MWHYDSDSDIVTILYSWVRLSTTTTTSTAGLMFSKWRCNIQDLLQWIENYTFCWITTKSMFTLLSWISYSEFQTFCETISVVFHHPTIYIYIRYTALGWFEVFRYLWHLQMRMYLHLYHVLTLSKTNLSWASLIRSFLENLYFVHMLIIRGHGYPLKS